MVIAFLCLAVFYRRHLNHITRASLAAGALVGACLAAGYQFQTAGLGTYDSVEICLHYRYGRGAGAIAFGHSRLAPQRHARASLECLGRRVSRLCRDRPADHAGPGREKLSLRYQCGRHAGPSPALSASRCTAWRSRILRTASTCRNWRHCRSASVCFSWRLRYRSAAISYLHVTTRLGGCAIDRFSTGDGGGLHHPVVGTAASAGDTHGTHPDTRTSLCVGNVVPRAGANGCTREPHWAPYWSWQESL